MDNNIILFKVYSNDRRERSGHRQQNGVVVVRLRNFRNVIPLCDLNLELQNFQINLNGGNWEQAVDQALSKVGFAHERIAQKRMDIIEGLGFCNYAWSKVAVRTTMVVVLGMGLLAFGIRTGVPSEIKKQGLKAVAKLISKSWNAWKTFLAGGRGLRQVGISALIWRGHAYVWAQLSQFETYDQWKRQTVANRLDRPLIPEQYENDPVLSATQGRLSHRPIRYPCYERIPNGNGERKIYYEESHIVAWIFFNHNSPETHQPLRRDGVFYAGKLSDTIEKRLLCLELLTIRNQRD